MPFKSKSQQRFMFAAEERGDVPKGTAMEWAHKTPDIKKLPEKVKKTAAEIALEVMKKDASFAPAALVAMDWAKKRRNKLKGPMPVVKGKEASDLVSRALATSSSLRDFYEGGKGAPGGVEYLGPFKIASLINPEVIAQAVANNADDVLLALVRRQQRLQQSSKQASVGLVPDELARNYFFSNPYGLDFESWAGMQDTNQGEDIPAEPMPEVEGEEPPYDADTEAAYMPNAPDTAEVGTEPPVSPVAPVPLPKGRVRKTAALLHAAAEHELSRRGILKVSTPENKSDLRCKVEAYLQRKAAAELIPGGLAAGESDTKYPKKQLEMGVEIEKEHSPVQAKAKEIAKDHLEEHPQYYSALKAMEKRLEEKKEAAYSSKYDLEAPYTDPLAKLPLYMALGAGSSGLGTGMGKAFRNEIGGFRSALKLKDLIKHIKNMPMSGHAKILGKGILGGGLAAGAGFLGGNLLEGKIREDAANKAGRKLAAAKFGLDASELLGQDEQRKDDLHQQTVRHNEENHEIELQKGQLELQQAQETFGMKQQQQAQKNQEQMAQQQMAQQMQAQQQQQMSQQYMSNMAGGGGQQPPQQGTAGPR